MNKYEESKPKKKKKHLSLDKGKKIKSENVGLNGPILQTKKKVFLFYIYNFYFDNLIYKWIK